MNNTKAISFWTFLSEHIVEIPIIQRDYAQGRKGKEELRRVFLTDIKYALDNKEEMKLDFVYGAEIGDSLSPLDGQQRLTTLWLLHWYVALRANRLDEAGPILRRFTYETRVSSREFCGQLCNASNFVEFGGIDIVGFIKKQTWFYTAWEQDPTIQSMLRMISGTHETDKNGVDFVDGIEEMFSCPEDCNINIIKKCALLQSFELFWSLLTGENCPIVFNYLPLKDFGLSDDLYVKMNARGKQLTSFENFKADMIGYISKRSEDDEAWKNLLDATNGIPIKMDNSWVDIFWKNKSEDCKIDDIYFAFLNRFFWNELFTSKGEDGKYILDIGKGEENSTQENDNKSYRYLNNSEHPNDYDTSIAYTGFEVYKYYKGSIPIEFFESLQSVLDEFSKFSRTIEDIGNLIGCKWDKDFKFIPEYEINPKVPSKNIIIRNNSNVEILKVTHLTQVQRIVFFALCKYFKDEKGNELNRDNLQHWMRVVWNLISGEDADGRPQIRSTSAVCTAIDFIDELESHAVYESLIKKVPYTNNLSDFKSRCNEEIAKAKQILDENGNLRKYEGVHKREDGFVYNTWEEIICESENYPGNNPFFKGTIRFLFQDKNGNIDWNDFDTKWTSAKEYFNDKNNVHTIELAKYCTDSQIKEIWNKYSFSEKYWKPILLEKSITEPIHRFLMKEDCNNDSVLYKDINNLLPKTGTAVWLLSDWLCCKVVLTNYSQKRSEPYNGWVFEVGNDIRNQFNKIIVNIDNSEIIILPPPASGEEKQICNGQVYYRGLWTDIEYQGHYFRYHGNNIICLMDKENKNNKKLKDPNKFDALGNYYYAAIDKNENKETILGKLNNLVKEASQNEQ